MFCRKTILAVVLSVLTGSASAYAPAVPVADLELFLGVAPGAISAISPGPDSAIEGSAIRDSFGFVVNDVISFDYNFMTDEVPPVDYVNDYAFVSIGGQVTLLDHVLRTPPLLASSPYYLETGNQTFSFLAPSTGYFNFGIGVVDVADGVVDSALLIDNIQITRAGNVEYLEGFEVFDPISIGDVEAGGAFFGRLPTEGNYQTLITTAPSVAPVPLPPAAWLLFSGVAALMGLSRKQRNS